MWWLILVLIIGLLIYFWGGGPASRLRCENRKRNEQLVRSAAVRLSLVEGRDRMVAELRRRYPLIPFKLPSIDDLVSRPLPDDSKLRPEQVLVIVLSEARRSAVKAYLEFEPDFLAHGIIRTDAMPVSYWEDEEKKNRRTTPGTLPQDWSIRRTVVHRRDGGCCRRCGINVGISECHVHHLEWKSKTGNHEFDNLVILCESCHSLMPDHVGAMKWYDLTEPIGRRRGRGPLIRSVKPREMELWSKSLLESITESLSTKYQLEFWENTNDFTRPAQIVQPKQVQSPSWNQVQSPAHGPSDTLKWAPRCILLVVTIIGVFIVVKFNPSRQIAHTSSRQQGSSIPSKSSLQQPPTMPRSLPKSSDLIRAAYEGRLRDVQDLLENGADPNARGNEQATVLMAACINGNIDVVRMLVQYGATVNAEDREGWTALRYALDHGHREIAAFLRRKGAKDILLESAKEAVTKGAYPQDSGKSDALAGKLRGSEKWRRLQQGWSMDQVSALLGRPKETYVGPVTVYWGYRGGGMVEFDANTRTLQTWRAP